MVFTDRFASFANILVLKDKIKKKSVKLFGLKNIGKKEKNYLQRDFILRQFFHYGT